MDLIPVLTCLFRIVFRAVRDTFLCGTSIRGYAIIVSRSIIVFWSYISFLLSNSLSPSTYPLTPSSSPAFLFFLFLHTSFSSILSVVFFFHLRMLSFQIFLSIYVAASFFMLLSSARELFFKHWQIMLHSEISLFFLFEILFRLAVRTSWVLR